MLKRDLSAFTRKFRHQVGLWASVSASGEGSLKALASALLFRCIAMYNIKNLYRSLVSEPYMGTVLKTLNPPKCAKLETSRVGTIGSGDVDAKHDGRLRIMLSCKNPARERLDAISD